MIRQLQLMGFHAMDADDGYTRIDADGFQQWNETAVDALLVDERADILFFAGCEENMIDYLSRFDCIVLLSAPKEVLLRRIEDRTNNPFGKTQIERERILFDLEHIEPRLRKIANFEVNTDDDFELVVEQILLLT